MDEDYMTLFLDLSLYSFLFLFEKKLRYTIHMASISKFCQWNKYQLWQKGQDSIDLEEVSCNQKDENGHQC